MSASSTAASDPGFHPEASDHIEPYVWKIAGVVILGMIMSILDTTIVNVALHTLSRDLHSSISQIQWVVTGYLLALAAVIPVTGWASRRFGAKRVYLVSLVLFTAGSALCAVAGSITTLVLFRVLQGVGGGMIMPIAQLIMAQVAGPKRMGRVMGVVVMPAMLAPILGPVIGGVILQELHWSWIFLVNAPRVVCPILVGIALTLAFGWHALRVQHPLLDIRLYANRVFGAASLTTFGLGASLFGAVILIPLYYHTRRPRARD